MISRRRGRAHSRGLEKLFEEVKSAHPTVLAPQEVAEIERRLGIKFRDPSYLNLAFVHRSYINEAKIPGLESNERVEFLGDGVLEMAVTQYLYRTFPKLDEGTLTNYRSALVRNQMLARIVTELRLGEFLRLSRGEKKFSEFQERAQQRIRGCLFEAIVGAIYLDRGPGAAELFINEVLISRLQEIIDLGLFTDAKSQLQELAQDQLGITPHYTILKEEGPDHNKQFLSGAFFDDRQVGQGRGNNKADAEDAAANEALQAEFHITLTGHAL